MVKRELKFSNDSESLEAVRRLSRAGHQALYAGGAVRDALMGHAESDVDVATSANSDQVEALFEKTIPIGKQFGIVSVVMAKDSKPIEVATFRMEKGVLDHRHPKEVSFSDAKEDALRRDFTINGMFYDPLNKELLDYVGGEADLKRKLIRSIGDPQERFDEDYLRMLRAIRFSAKLGFEIEKETFEAIKSHSKFISSISQERIASELTKILLSADRMRGFKLLDESGLLEEVLPEIVNLKGVEQSEIYHPEGDVFTHTLLVLDKLKNLTPETAYGALLHDVGKAPAFKIRDGKITFYNHQNIGAQMAEKIMSRFRLSKELTRTVKDIVRDHLKFFDVQKMKESTLRKFLSEPHFEQLLEVHYADCMGGSGELKNYHFCMEEIKKYKESNRELRPDPIYTGENLKAWGIAQGPVYGEILEKLYNLQLEGSLPDLEKVRELAVKISSKP